MVCHRQSILLLTVIAALLPDRAWALDNRIQSVNRELDCVIQAFGQQQKVSWSDVCYTQESSQPSVDRVRRASIEQELDDFESEFEYGRESAYRNSLEYLEQFMANAQQRPIEYEHPVYGRAKSEEIAIPPLEYDDPLPAYNYSSFDDIDDVGLETDRLVKGKVDLGVGYRTDQLDWNISGNLNGENPNIFLEYVFEDVRSAQLKAQGELLIGNHFVLDGWAAFGKIVDGSNEVSEYDMNDRQALAVRTTNKTDEDIVWDVSGALGVRINVPNEDAVTGFLNLDDLKLTLLAGYSHHEQKFNIKDGNTTVDNTATPDLGSFPGLNSSYNAEWKGPFLGGEIAGKMDRLTGAFRVEYHMADYYGWGQLNLRPEFQQPKSFDHVADAFGWMLDFNLAYQLTANFNIDVNAAYNVWHTEEGVDRLFLNDGTLAEERQLNEVNWEAYALMVGGTYRFH